MPLVLVGWVLIGAVVVAVDGVLLVRQVVTLVTLRLDTVLFRVRTAARWWALVWQLARVRMRHLQRRFPTCGIWKSGQEPC